MGDAANVGQKLDVLRAHCREVDRDPADIEVTLLSSVVVGEDAPSGITIAGTADDHIGRYRELAEAGVQTAIVGMPALDERSIEAFAPVIAAFR